MLHYTANLASPFMSAQSTLKVDPWCDINLKLKVSNVAMLMLVVAKDLC